MFAELPCATIVCSLHRSDCVQPHAERKLWLPYTGDMWQNRQIHTIRPIGTNPRVEDCVSVSRFSV